MIIYHAVWDLVYIFGCDWKWYKSDMAFYWQQSICWSFIFISGFCWKMSKRNLRRGLQVFGGGLVITFATLVFMPDSRVIFGVLTLIGSSIATKDIYQIPNRMIDNHIDQPETSNFIDEVKTWLRYHFCFFYFFYYLFQLSFLTFLLYIQITIFFNCIQVICLCDFITFFCQFFDILYFVRKICYDDIRYYIGNITSFQK